MRDYLSISQSELKMAFEQALKDHNTVEARTIWGLFEKNEREKRENYLRILSEEEKYEDMKKYSYKFGVCLPARECLSAYAFNGDVDSFINHYKNNKTNFWYLAYLTVVLFNNSNNITRKQLNEIVRDINSGNYILKGQIDSSDGRLFLCAGLRLLADFWDIMLEEHAYSEVLTTNEKEEYSELKDKYVLIFYTMYSKLFNMHDDEGIYMCMDTLDRIVDQVENFFIGDNKEISFFVEFIFAVFFCHLDKRAVEYTKTHLEYVRQQYLELQNKSLFSLIDRIRSLYIRSYSTSILINGIPDIQIEEFLSFIGVDNIPLDEQIEIRRLTAVLSPKAQIAYDSAYKLYLMALRNNYGHSDAGPISLAFYRIIESESTEKIWKPLVNKCGIDTLINAVNEELLLLDDNKARKYKQEWIGTRGKMGYLDTLKDIVKDKKGLMLGELFFFTEFARKQYQNDNVAKLFYNELRNILTEQGFAAFKEERLSALYCRENRDKYRNPPAHNKYLSFKMMTECKDYVDSQLLNLSRWCK